MDVDATEFARLAVKLREVDKSIARNVRKALTEAAVPAGEKSIAEGSDSMPARGGLRDRIIAGGRATVRLRKDSADVTLTNREGIQLGPINKGQLRHPVFARAGMSNAEASRMVSEAVAESGGKLKYGMRRAVSRLRNKGRTWVTQQVPAGTYTKAIEGRLDEIRPLVADAVDKALRELS